jgi:hypothetical protein
VKRVWFGFQLYVAVGTIAELRLPTIAVGR